MERFEIINNQLDDMKTRQSNLNLTLAAVSKNGLSGSKNQDKIYDDFLGNEKKKEIDEFLKNIKREVEGKFMALEKDIVYLSEV